MEQLGEFMTKLSQSEGAYVNVYLAVLRYVAPLLAFIIILRCLKPLLSFKREPEIWAWLYLNDGTKYALTHWENVIGRAKSSDICIDFPTVSRNHAVLTRYDDGSWTITDAESKSGVLVNNQPVQICALDPDDVITIGGIEMTLTPITQRQEQLLSQLRTRAGSGLDSMGNLLLLTLFQCLCCLGFMFRSSGEDLPQIILGFGSLIVCQWLLMIFFGIIRRTSFELETVAFFLCTLGTCVLATVAPGDILKQGLAMILGILTFMLVGWTLRDLERAKKFRYIATVMGVGFLVITLLFGVEYYGSKSWLKIGDMTIQPSELSKLCFVYAGASTMDRLMKKRNMILFIAYSVVICGFLALMNDFGTALIFFCAFLVIAYLRSGSVGTVGLAVTALGFAGVLVLKIAPHAFRRFEIWRHVWEDPFGQGFQQTRAIMCIASGGLLGLGAGNGKLKNVFAADSDIAFATLSEEWGLIMAVMAVVCIAAIAVFVVRSAVLERSSFYSIGASTAASILLTQTILNCLGTVDVLPLTGVTFPFLSSGGSSMICAWGLLAFIKAADTRQNASFAVRLAGRGRDPE